MVVLTDEDFAGLPLTTSRTIDVLQFVPLEQVDPIYFAKSYYLEPDRTGTKPYACCAMPSSSRTGSARESRAAPAREARDPSRARRGFRARDDAVAGRGAQTRFRVPRRGRLGAPAGAGHGGLSHRDAGRRVRSEPVHRRVPRGAAGGHRGEGCRARGGAPAAGNLRRCRAGPHGRAAGTVDAAKGKKSAAAEAAEESEEKQSKPAKAASKKSASKKAAAPRKRRSA